MKVDKQTLVCPVNLRVFFVLVQRNPRLYEPRPYLLEPDVSRGRIGGSPHKRQVPLQLFVRVREGVALGEAAQGVSAGRRKGPGATHQPRTPPPGSHPLPGAFHATGLKQEAHEVPRASYRH